MAEHSVDVDSVLRNAKERYKTVEVHKDIEPQFDVGNLLATDTQPVELKDIRNNKEYFLRNLARDNTQLLFNEIWKLPTERYEGVVVAKLPAPSTALPREKPVPKPRPPTKWEEFAKAKGIKKRKRERMIWDDQKKVNEQAAPETDKLSQMLNHVWFNAARYFSVKNVSIKKKI